MTRDEINVTIEIIKQRFPNLTVTDTVNFACDIIEAIDKTRVKLVDNSGMAQALSNEPGGFLR